MMKRVILDTNIYGRILKENDVELILNGLTNSGLVIYGCDAVKKELRKISKEEFILSSGKVRKLRDLILGLYYNLAKKDLSITNEILDMADLYHKTYVKLGGVTSREKLMNDFIIVALASKNNLDVVYSDDTETMISRLSMKSYDIVNTIRKIKTARFRNYGEFKNDITK